MMRVCAPLCVLTAVLSAIICRKWVVTSPSAASLRDRWGLVRVPVDGWVPPQHFSDVASVTTADDYIQEAIRSFLAFRDGGEPPTPAGEVLTAASTNSSSRVPKRNLTSWGVAYHQRIQGLSADQRKSRSADASTRTAMFLGVIQRMEAVGMRPILRAGALIGAVRHRGWIDFGGTAYQTGYDSDPDAMLTTKELQRLIDKPDLLAPFQFRLDGERRGRFDVDSWIRRKGTLRWYVKWACDKPVATTEFYRSLGLDLDAPSHGALYLPGVSASALELSALHSWAGGGVGKDAKSFIYTMCWRGVARTRPPSSIAMLIPTVRLYPAKRVQVRQSRVLFVRV